MNTLRIIALLLLVLCGLTSSEVVPVAEAAKPSKEGMYKNYYSSDWFATFALSAFDKGAPAPGVNWFIEHTKNWLSKAELAGWVVKRQPEDAVNGAIVLGYDDVKDLSWIGIAREVTDQGLVFETFESKTGKSNK